MDSWIKHIQLKSEMRKHGILVISASLLGIGLYSFLFYSHFGESPSFPGNVIGFLSSILASVFAIYLIITTNSWLDRFISWKKTFLIRFSISTIAELLIGMLTIAGSTWIYFTLFLGEGPVLAEFKDEIIKTAILLFFTSIIFSTGYYVLYSYRQYSIVQIATITQDRKQLRLQFEALKSQLSPHYLFNSLNTISSLVYKDPDAAEEFIRRLALTFKYVITTDKQRLVPLKEEVEFIRSYYHLLKVRFGNSLNLDIDLPDDLLNTSIPPLTLQILVENAVKHNQFNQDNRLEIKVGHNEDQFLTIANNKLTPAEDVRSFRVGLENIKRRYSFYSESAIRIENEGDFIVQLPILELQKAS
jgi:sensor histidine kinase YesM